MSDSLEYYVGLSALLEEDLSSYEYFHSLPKKLQDEIERRDFGSFEEMQAYAKSRKPLR